jgi:hypothetical protein
MASAVLSAFYETLDQHLSTDIAELLEPRSGGGPPQRELQRALMLGDRAIREWAPTAVTYRSPTTPSRLEGLPQLGRPEDIEAQVVPLAKLEAQSAGVDESGVFQAVIDLVEPLEALDTESTNAGNAAELRAAGARAARVLIAASRLLGEAWALSQANETMRDLVALDGWVNRLGTRYEIS